MKLNYDYVPPLIQGIGYLIGIPLALIGFMILPPITYQKIMDFFT